MTHVIILAAGKGTRMKSDMPKVLHPVLGVPIVSRLLSEVVKVCPVPTLIVGHKAQDVIDATGNKYHYVIQQEQKGTGHAVACAAADLVPQYHGQVVVLLGDHPLVSASTIENLVAIHKQEKATITLATAIVPNYEGLYSVFLNYGRVVRSATGEVEKIVEFKDASEDLRATKEINPSYYCFDAPWLWENISKLESKNAAGEFYLTDMIERARSQGLKVVPSLIKNIKECLGINTPEQLKQVEDVIASNIL